MKKASLVLLVFALSCTNNNDEQAKRFFEKFPSLENAKQNIKNDTVLYDSDGNGFFFRVQPSKETPNLEVQTSINGEVVYEYRLGTKGEVIQDSSSKKMVKRIYSYKYFNENLQASISADTLQKGEVFVGTITGFQKDIRIKVDDVADTLSKEDLPYKFKRAANDIGVHYFSGVVYSGGKEIPFQYKYLVK
jgi:hypothetical protein